MLITRDELSAPRRILTRIAILAANDAHDEVIEQLRDLEIWAAEMNEVVRLDKEQEEAA